MVVVVPQGGWYHISTSRRQLASFRRYLLHVHPVKIVDAAASTAKDGGSPDHLPPLQLDHSVPVWDRPADLVTIGRQAQQAQPTYPRRINHCRWGSHTLDTELDSHSLCFLSLLRGKRRTMGVCITVCHTLFLCVACIQPCYLPKPVHGSDLNPITSWTQCRVHGLGHRVRASRCCGPCPCTLALQHYSPPRIPRCGRWSPF